MIDEWSAINAATIMRLRARAEKAEAEVERLTWALKEIAVGRTSVDNDDPTPFTSMAGRFLSIAQDALKGGGA